MTVVPITTTTPSTSRLVRVFSTHACDGHIDPAHALRSRPFAGCTLHPARRPFNAIDARTVIAVLPDREQARLLLDQASLPVRRCAAAPRRVQPQKS
jgi:hypothetical protein